MSQLKTHAESLTKVEVDEFAQEYFGIQLDRRKSKGAMVRTLLEKAEGTDPLKPLPWEELLVEDSESDAPLAPESVSKVDDDDDGTIAPMDVEKPSPVELAGFTPVVLPYKRGGEPFIPVHFEVVEMVRGILDGSKTVDDITHQEHIIKSILWYVENDGKCLVRETRHSDFITFQKGK